MKASWLNIFVRIKCGDENTSNTNILSHEDHHHQNGHIYYHMMIIITLMAKMRGNF